MQKIDRKPSGKDGNRCVFNAAKFSMRIFFFNPAHLLNCNISLQKKLFLVLYFPRLQGNSSSLTTTSHIA